MRFLLVVVMLVMGFVTKAEAQYTGQSINIILQAYGTPNSKIVTRSGNSRYIYYIEYKNSPAMPMSTNNPVVFVGPKGQSFGFAPPAKTMPYRVTRCTLIFDVNKQNVIVSESRQGDC